MPTFPGHDETNELLSLGGWRRHYSNIFPWARVMFSKGLMGITENLSTRVKELDAIKCLEGEKESWPPDGADDEPWGLRAVQEQEAGGAHFNCWGSYGALLSWNPATNYSHMPY